MFSRRRIVVRPPFDEETDMMTTNRLPSLRSLLAFEAAARHLSFTKAASELNLTQTAVSHQIKVLETHLGMQLFQRDRNIVRMTAEAETYLLSIRSGLTTIGEATEELTRGSAQKFLNVSCLVTFGLKCLTPKLQKFSVRHPEISVNLAYPTRFRQFKDRDFDVAIQYGNGKWDGYTADLLCHSEIFPVCAPQIYDQIDLSRGPSELQRFPCLHTPYFLCRDDWKRWFNSVGLKLDFDAGQFSFNTVVGALQAAVDGVGVAMGRTPLVAMDLEAGRLKVPFDLRIKSGFGYYIITPAEKQNLPKVRRFREWMLETFQDPQPPAMVA
jgi:DNA-binding transcriptional LysR family regulator